MLNNFYVSFSGSMFWSLTFSKIYKWLSYYKEDKSCSIILMGDQYLLKSKTLNHGSQRDFFLGRFHWSEELWQLLTMKGHHWGMTEKTKNVAEKWRMLCLSKQIGVGFLKIWRSWWGIANWVWDSDFVVQNSGSDPKELKSQDLNSIRMPHVTPK